MRKVLLRAPAGTLAALKEAVKAGADGVYTAFSSASNVRNFPGLNLTLDQLKEGTEFAHRRSCQVFLAVNSYPQTEEALARACEEITQAVELGIDGVILADFALLKFAWETFPQLPVQLSVQAGASTARAINWLVENYGVKGAVLPRVLALDEIKALRQQTQIELEVFIFGLLCINYEPKCLLSCYLTGIPNATFGACSPAQFVSFEEENGVLQARLNQFLLNSFEPGEVATYPTPCKGRYREASTQRVFYPFQPPSTLNLLPLLPNLIEAGVDALKIEGRQRSKVYVKETVKVFREAIDTYYENPANFKIKQSWNRRLGTLFEGSRFTLASLGEKS